MKKLYLLAAAALCAATATAANGDVTDGWLMLEDFEATAPAMSAFNISGGEGQGTCETATIAKDGNDANKVGQFTVGGGYSHGIQFEFTLPEGKTINDYTEISVDIYGVSGDVTWKKLEVYVDGKRQGEVSGAIENATTWKTSNLELSATGTSNKVSIGFYNATNTGAVIAYDNIQLKEKEGGSVTPDPDPTPDPGTYDESKNGIVTDGWLMIQDYQTKKPGDEATVGNYFGGNGSGISAKIEVDPKKATNLVATATLTNSDWNTMFALDVVLPEGTTLKDYSAIAFDIYRFTATGGNRPILVKAGDEYIKPDGSFEEIKTGEWISKEYAISEDTKVGNSFKLYFGIKTDNANYAVDNIRLKAKETSEPELEVVGTPAITIKHGTAAGIITVSYSFEVKNHNGEEINVVATVDGHDDVIFEGPVAEPNNAPARAAGENKTFSGNLKAQHDVLKTISNPNVRLTATAGEKQLFAITKAPDTTTGIEDVTVDSEAPVEYFNLQGLRVAQPEAGQLYIKRQGDKAVKVRF